MTQYTPLYKEQHKNFGIQLDEPFAFSYHWTFIPVASIELAKIFMSYPVCFQKQGNTYTLGIPTGIGKVNCLIHPKTSKFLLPYVPGILRRYPFNILSSQSKEPVLCVLKSETGFALNQGKAIIDETGEITKYGEELTTFITHLNKSFEEDQSVCEKLAELDLFTPLPINVLETETGEQHSFRDDLYRIDEHKLKQLSGDDLKSLMSIDGFSLIYTHLISLFKLDNIGILSNAYLMARQNPTSEIDNLDSFFKDDDDSNISFQ